MITDELLDRLRFVESSNNPKAVNPKTGAQGAYQFMPGTVEMLRKQGIEFDPFDEPQSREAAKAYLGQLLEQHGGDLDKALAAYGGFKTKDPSQYIAKVKGEPQDELMSIINEKLKSAKEEKPLTLDDLISEKLTTIKEAPVKAAQAQMATLLTAVPQLDASGKVVRQALAPEKSRSIKDYIGGGVEAAGSLITSGVAAPFAAGAQLASDVTTKLAGKTPEPGSPVYSSIMERYQPRTEVGQEIVGGLGKAFEATKLPPVMTPEMMALGQTRVGAIPGAVTGKPKYTLPEIKETQAIIKGTSPLLQKYQEPFSGAGMRSAGAAAVGDPARVDAVIASLPIEVQEQARKAVAKAGGPKKANVKALEAEAESLNLPVPMRLLPGQASDDPIVKAYEFNNRAKLPFAQERFSNQPVELADNLNAVQEMATPNIFDRKPASLGNSLTTAYQQFDESLNAVINDKYKTLKEAAGGDIPVDATQAHSNLQKFFEKELMLTDVTNKSTSFAELKKFAANGTMTFDQMLALRKKLGRDLKNPDGDIRYAAQAMINELDNIPFDLKTAELKAMADDARSTAKARFNKLDPTKPEYDPVYKAVLDGKTPNEHLIDNFVLGKRGSEQGLANLIDNLGDNGREIVAAAIMEKVKQQAITKTGDNKVEFKPAKYREALDKLEPKLRATIGNDLFLVLDSVSNVAARTVAREKAAVYNLSGTLSGGILQEAAGKMLSDAEQSANLLGYSQGVPIAVGTSLRGFLGGDPYKKLDKQLSAPFAGVKEIKLRDIGKK